MNSNEKPFLVGSSRLKPKAKTTVATTSSVLLFAFCLSAVTSQGQTQPAASGRAAFPQETVQNKLLRVHLYLPDAQEGYYRGTRFDWSGLISRVEYRGHSFFSEFNKEHNPLNHDDVCGTAEEFSMTTLPLGFKEARPGETFVKIGVGVLRRGDVSAYGFAKKYQITKPGDWKISRRPEAIEFSQSLEAPGGWAYDYSKTISLDADAPALRIKRVLKNTGTRPIKTDHYGHNFLRIDDAPAGANHAIEFPFKPSFSKDAQTAGCVSIEGNALVFHKEVGPGKAVWVPLEGFRSLEDNRIRVVDRRTKTAVTIETDRPLSRLVFYSSNGALCPEPFVEIDLASGETATWTTTYRFEAP